MTIFTANRSAAIYKRIKELGTKPEDLLFRQIGTQVALIDKNSNYVIDTFTSDEYKAVQSYITGK